MPPRWGFRIFAYHDCYKHAAPLGLKAPTHQNSRCDSHRRGGGSPPDGLGNPTPTHLPLPCFLTFHVTHSPLWGFRIFAYHDRYKHAAPLGLKAPTHQNSRCDSHRRGGGSPPDGLGTQPLHICRMHDSPLWGFSYKHVAPLGLKAPTHQNSRCDIHRRGGGSPPDGLGNPTPTHFTASLLPHVSRFQDICVSRLL